MKRQKLTSLDLIRPVVLNIDFIPHVRTSTFSLHLSQSFQTTQNVDVWDKEPRMVGFFFRRNVSKTTRLEKNAAFFKKRRR